VDLSFHESDDRLELYALGRLSDSDVIEIEEHLLFCDACRERLDQTARIAVAFRDALKFQPAAPVAGQTRWFGWLKPQFALAGGFGVVLLAFVLVRGNNVPMATVASLQLTAMRGTESHSVHAAQELDLTFADAVAGAGAPSVEVVDSRGAVVWQGPPEIVAGVARAKIHKVLWPGDYFARFYDSPGHLVHEYAFGVKK
jgi:anti-sigma factor RsiW